MTTTHETNPSPDSNKTAAQDSSTSPEPAFGWTAYAEMINGRFAMIGFIALLIIEIITHQDFFTWLGLR
jgi:hypothetical protein